MADSPTKAARDARIDALVTATKDWAKNRRAELQARVDSSKRILKGRTGAERLAAHTINTAKELVVDEIDQFLVG